jgi:hypothetical protein
MAPESFETFFLASAGAGGAFVGLLFVAISIGPQRTFDPRAVAGIQHQRLAEATLLTLFNGFVLSCVALVPGIDVGWVAFVAGAAGVLIAAQLIGFLARSHRHEVSRRLPWLHHLRVVSLSLVAALMFAIEGLLGLRLILRPADVEAYRWLAVIIIALYGLGILRAWTLLGDPQHGWSGWLNPLQDLLEREATSETDVPADSSRSELSSSDVAAASWSEKNLGGSQPA